MSNTNYFSGIVKIIETPIVYSVKQQIQVTRFRVAVPQKRKNTIVHLLCWGNLGREVKKFYLPNDYVLIEGYTSIRSKKGKTLNRKISKRIFITVTRIYPVLLNTNRSSTKI